MKKRLFGFAWWLLVVGVIGFSVWAAIKYDTDDAYREMATSAFGGAIVGLIILVYEQFREERRDEKQLERDRQMARALRDDANRETDIRTFADFVLQRINPVILELETEVEMGIANIPDSFFAVKADIAACSRLAARIGDKKLNEAWNDFTMAHFKYCGFGVCVDVEIVNQLISGIEEVIELAEELLEWPDTIST